MRTILDELIQRYPSLNACKTDIWTAFEMLQACYERDDVLYLCGNGGSAADAEHIVGELMKSFAMPRKISEDVRSRLEDEALAEKLEGALRAIALTGSHSLATAFANDVDPDLVFAQQVYGYGRPSDVLWGISTSGNSKNIIHALKVAKAKRMFTLGLTGQDGGAMAALCDVCIRVAEKEVFKVQELHLPVYHALCRMLEIRFFS